MVGRGGGGKPPEKFKRRTPPSKQINASNPDPSIDKKSWIRKRHNIFNFYID